MHKIIIALIIVGAFYYLYKNSNPLGVSGGGTRPSFAPGVDTPKVTPGLVNLGYMYAPNLQGLGVQKYV